MASEKHVESNNTGQDLGTKKSNMHSLTVLKHLAKSHVHHIHLAHDRRHVPIFAPKKWLKICVPGTQSVYHGTWILSG